MVALRQPLAQQDPPTRAEFDEGAQLFRFDGALDSDMMSPRSRSLAGF